MQINNKNKNQSSEDAIRNDFWIDDTKLYDDARRANVNEHHFIFLHKGKASRNWNMKYEEMQEEMQIIIILIDSDTKLTKDFVSIYEWIDKYWCKKELYSMKHMWWSTQQTLLKI